MEELGDDVDNEVLIWEPVGGFVGSRELVPAGVISLLLLLTDTCII